MAPDAFATAVAPLFEGAPAYVRRLADARPFETEEGLFDAARGVAREMPRAGAGRAAERPPTDRRRSRDRVDPVRAEQGYDAEAGPDESWIADELTALNEAYEGLFGFRFVVFVAGRPRADIIPILEHALRADRDEELRRALDDVVLIARDRWDRLRGPRPLAEPLRESIALEVSRFMVGETGRDGLLRATHRLIEEGVESPALLALSIADSDGEADLGAPIARLMSEIGLEGWEASQAGQLLALHAAASIVGDVSHPIDGARRIVAVSANPQFRELVTRWEANEGDHERDRARHPARRGRPVRRGGGMRHEIRYGKADVKVYRTHAEPLTGITPIPESPFTGRENLLAAAEIEVVVRGTRSSTPTRKGDNRLVVATDTMKNFIHADSLRARARTLEEWLLEVGTAFLDTYPHMERLTMLGRDLPFPAALVPAADGDGFEASDRPLQPRPMRLRLGAPRAGTRRRRRRRDHRPRVRPARAAADQDHRLRLRRLRPRRAHDPSRAPRPAAVHLVRHRLDATPMRRTPSSADPSRYVAGEQVADLANRRLPRVRVASRSSTSSTRSGCGCSTAGRSSRRSASRRQNRLWDVGAEARRRRSKTYADPRPPFGHIGLVLRRD